MIAVSEIAGFVASGLVLLTFAMRDMRLLRTVAICSNVAFIIYGELNGLLRQTCYAATGCDAGFAMATRIALARALVRNTNLSVMERRRQLTQITADVRRDYDQQIARIRSEIAELGTTAAVLVWQTIVGVVTRVPFKRSTNVAAIAKLRIQLAEAHTAKFAAMAELKILKTFA